MEIEEEDEKDKETYVVGELGIVHATWRMVGFKMSLLLPLESPRLKIRLEEKKTQVSLNHSPIW